MAIGLSDAAWDLPLGLSEKAVLVVLCGYASERNHFRCWPSVTTLSRRCSMKDRSVRKALRKLEKCGLIRTESRLGRSNCYFVFLESGTADRFCYGEAEVDGQLHESRLSELSFYREYLAWSNNFKGHEVVRVTLAKLKKLP